MQGDMITNPLKHQHTFCMYMLCYEGQERENMLVFSCSLQKSETNLTKDRNHLKDKEILGWGISPESWQLNTIFPDQK